MKKIASILFFVSLMFFVSCETTMTMNFNENGSGTYNVTTNLSQMLKMGIIPTENVGQRDTVFVTNKLNKELFTPNEIEKIDKLKDFKGHLKSDTIQGIFKFDIGASFNKWEDLEAIEILYSKTGAVNNFNEMLNSFSKEVLRNENTIRVNDFDIYSNYNISFDKKKFTLKVKPEQLAKIKADEKVEKTPASPIADVVTIKMVYTFPYKIKKVTNKRASILNDNKTIRIEGGIAEIVNNPRFFETEVFFEN